MDGLSSDDDEVQFTGTLDADAARERDRAAAEASGNAFDLCTLESQGEDTEAGYMAYFAGRRGSTAAAEPDTDGEEGLENFRAVIREHEDDTKHVIDRAVVLKGLRLAVQPGHVSSEICEDALADIGAGDAGGQLDAFGADAIVQLGLFGEIVYG